MRAIGTTDFRMPAVFGAWFKPDEHLEVVRYYCSSQTRTYMLWNVMTVFDATNKWARSMDEEVGRWVSDEQTTVREACLCLTTVKRFRPPEFTAHNYLDALGPRLHLVVSGSGSYERPGQVCSYVPGSVLMFDEQTFGKQLTRRTTEDTTELVFCLGPKSGKTNWQLFREHREARGRK